LTVLRSAGHAAVVSGAGPSVLVLCSEPAARLAAAEVIAQHGRDAWEVHLLTVDERGATVETLPALAD
jgi:homoserine kinase